MNDTEVKTKEEKEMYQNVANLKGKLIVSCQALPNEPLHSSFIMGRMALAAKEGGASGIRANSKEDIKEIQSKVDLPIIGIVKRDYADSAVYITPTMKEIEELMEVKPDIIAIISLRISKSFFSILSPLLCSVYPTRVVPIKSKPRSSAWRASSMVEQSAIQS